MSKFQQRLQRTKANSAKRVTASAPWSLSSLEPRLMLAGDVAIAVSDCGVATVNDTAARRVAGVLATACNKLVFPQAS